MLQCAYSSPPLTYYMVRIKNRDVWGGSGYEFAVHRDAIVKIVNLAPPYLSNYQESDHGEQNYSERNFSRLGVLARFENLYLATMGEIQLIH